MGIYNFFWKWIRKEQSECLSFVKEGYNIPSTDMLLIDANAIFHPICRELFDKNPLASYTDAYKAICMKLYEIIKQVNPIHTVYIAIDGVAGLCKQTQQRKRRFESTLRTPSEKEKKPIFDTIHITAGTKFMNDLCIYIRNFFSKIISSKTIIINDMFVPGEGEHKLIHDIRKDKSHNSYMIYSPDADLIMLTLALNKPNIYILRVNDQKNNKAFIEDKYVDYFIIHVDRLASMVSMKYRWKSEPISEDKRPIVQPFIKKNFIVDLVMFMFVVGNDFLPHIDHIKIPTGGIDKLCRDYISVIPYTGFLVDPIHHNINTKAMHELMKTISSTESQLLIDKYKRCMSRNCFPDKVLESSISKTLSGKYEIDFELYRKNYYKKIGIIDVDLFCQEYFKGMSFVIQYYTRDIPTYDWYYPYHYPPLFTDLARYSGLYDLSFLFHKKPPLTLLESLFSVIPPSKYYALPDILQPKMNILSRTDSDFSEEFQIDVSGKEYNIDDITGEKSTYQGIVLLPTVSYNKIKALLQEFHIKDPDPIVYTIHRKVSPEKLGRIKYNLYISSKVYPRPGPGSCGTILTHQIHKIFEYGKYIEYTNSNELIEYMTLNDALTLFIKNIGKASERGIILRIISDRSLFIQSLRKLLNSSSTNEEEKQCILLLNYIRKLGYTIDTNIVEKEKNIEAREITEDVYLLKEDKLILVKESN
jgi:5'-3' exonuclease